MIAIYLIIGHLSLFVSPLVALAMGVAVALCTGNPYLEKSERISRKMLLYCFVGVGFGIDLSAISAISATSTTGLFVAVAAMAIFAMGLLLGRILQIKGGRNEAIALCSAVCAGAFLASALSLEGTLWILPLLLLSMIRLRPLRGILYIYVALAFVAAMLLGNYAPLPDHALEIVRRLPARGVSAMLFLFGLGVTPIAIKRAGVRPIWQILALVAVAALFWVATTLWF